MKSKVWKKEVQQREKISFEREENFYNTISNNEEQLEDKFKKMEVVEEENEEMKSNEEFVTYTTEKERHH